jgi:hypothetical protein
MTSQKIHHDANVPIVLHIPMAYQRTMRSESTSKTDNNFKKTWVQAGQWFPELVQFSSGGMYFQTGQVLNLKCFVEQRTDIFEMIQ